MGSRRDFFKKGGMLGLSFLSANLISSEQQNSLENLGRLGQDPFHLPPLPYAYDALEPYIDQQTMEIHYTKHHQAYVKKLNETPSTNLDYMSSDELKCTQINSATAAVIRNNLGGHFNHSLFWLLLKPNKEGKVNLPKAELAKAIDSEFKSFEDFKKEFSEKASKLFGSGWCWLIEKGGKLKVITTPNQDNPLMDVGGERGKILLALDVWEHAYYLKHQNKRVDYIQAWWNIVNWDKAEELYTTK